jgi:hypothetical protein
MRKIKRISRDEFVLRTKHGEIFTPAGLYEPDHAPPATEFLHVDLGGGHTRFMRVTTPRSTHTNLEINRG